MGCVPLNRQFVVRNHSGDAADFRNERLFVDRQHRGKTILGHGKVQDVIGRGDRNQ